jgi:uncharacterized repeat protein (TIGR01451 family)
VARKHGFLLTVLTFALGQTLLCPSPATAQAALPVYLSDLPWVSATNGWGPVERDKSNGEQGAGDGQTLSIRGQTYQKGLGVHAVSQVIFALGGAYTTFLAHVGIDDEVAGSVASVTFQVWVDGIKQFDSGPLHSTDAPVPVTVDVTGASQLLLVVTDAGDNFYYDHADWADARVLSGDGPPPSSVAYLSDLPWVSATNGWGPVERDKSNGEQGAGDGQTLSIRGQTYQKGLGVHAVSDIVYALDGVTYSAFLAHVGIDDEVTGSAASVTFQVWVDGIKQFDSGPLHSTDAPVPVAVSIIGATQLRLVVTDAGDNFYYDHADWADARLTTAPAPPGFRESVVFSGLTYPVAVEFAADGRVFVAERSGIIKVFGDLSATAPTVFADLRLQVHNFWDRGLLGMALHPDFPSTPYVYVLYARDAPVGGIAPLWGPGDGTSDPCPTLEDCLASGRLSRLTAGGNVMVGSEFVLIDDWCSQFANHSLAGLVFGPDGALYAGAGDATSALLVDYGQNGNACGHPPGEGGALRVQDLRTEGDPVDLNGTIIRVDPETGLGLSDNPLASHADPNARRIIAYGLRNPFRFAFRPGTTDLWIGDVGWNDWEEMNRIANPTNSVVNFGWPCYEGPAHQAGYDAADLPICEALYTDPGAVTAPFFAYHHESEVVPGDGCGTGSHAAAITGLAFYPSGGGSYPSGYSGALFFGDYSRNCIWVMSSSGGVPDPATIQVFWRGAPSPVDLKVGPGGDLFYVDINGGTVRRIQYLGANQPPVAAISATPPSGPPPLTVSFTGTGSSDPDPGDGIASYAWDLDGDGQYDDSTLAAPSFTYSTPGTYTVSLKVTDTRGASGTAATVITVGNVPSNTPPTATIDTPASTWTWTVGDVVAFTGHGTDQEDGALPATALSWAAILHHCTTPSACHTHLLQTFSGVASGSFTAPDHSYPSHLELTLTATDTGGLSDTKSVLLYPKTASLTLQSVPAGLQLTLDSGNTPAPFTSTVILGSTHSVSAPSPQTLSGTVYTFGSWSDGGGQTHNITVSSASVTHTATYEANHAPVAAISADPTSGPAPLTVSFSGAGSSDPDPGDSIASYAWDLDGDGQYDDSTLAAPSFTYATPGTYTVGLKVTDTRGASGTGSTVITVGAAPSADLQIVKTGSAAGGIVTFTLTVTNLSATTPAQGVALTDTLGDKLTYVSSSPGCSYAPATRTVACAIGALSPGQVVSVQITASAKGRGNVTNTGNVTATTPDPNAANNASTVTIRLR